MSSEDQNLLVPLLKVPMVLRRNLKSGYEVHGADKGHSGKSEEAAKPMLIPAKAYDTLDIRSGVNWRFFPFRNILFELSPE